MTSSLAVDRRTGRPAHLTVGARLALALAASWCVVLLVAAATVPVYEGSSASGSASISSTGEVQTVEQPAITTSSTLVEINGPSALVLVGIPLLVTGAVAVTLHRRGRRGRGAGPFAWTVVSLLGAFTLVGMFSIGFFILPVTALLIAACAVTRLDAAPRRPA